LWTPDAVLWTPDEHLWTRGAVLWTRGANPWTPGADLWTRDADNWSSGGLRGSLRKARAGPSSRPDMIRMRLQSDPPQPPANTARPAPSGFQYTPSAAAALPLNPNLTTGGNGGESSRRRGRGCHGEPNPRTRNGPRVDRTSKQESTDSPQPLKPGKPAARPSSQPVPRPRFHKRTMI
jgi:hypothetical protein